MGHVAQASKVMESLQADALVSSKRFPSNGLLHNGNTMKSRNGQE